MIPTVGRIVHYTLSQQDADAINKRRNDASVSNAGYANSGYVVHVGNQASEGQVYPMLITRVWTPGVETTPVQGQVFLDGNDNFWASSVMQGEGPRTWCEPARTSSVKETS